MFSKEGDLSPFEYGAFPIPQAGRCARSCTRLLGLDTKKAGPEACRVQPFFRDPIAQSMGDTFMSLTSLSARSARAVLR